MQCFLLLLLPSYLSQYFLNFSLSKLACIEVTSYFHNHLVIFIRCLVTRDYNFCTCQVLKLIYCFASFTNNSTSSIGWHFYMSLKFHFFFRSKEIFFFKFSIDSPLSLKLSFWRSSDDNHSQLGIWSFSRGNLNRCACKARKLFDVLSLLANNSSNCQGWDEQMNSLRLGLLPKWWI